MSEIIVEVISENVKEKAHSEVVKLIENVIKELELNNVKIVEKSSTDGSVTLKYGIVPSPSIAINGVLMIIGEKPTKKEIKDLILRATLNI